MSNNNDIAEYIHKERASGTSDQEIRSSLLEKGWPKKAINRAFRASNGTQTEEILPEPQPIVPAMPEPMDDQTIFEEDGTAGSVRRILRTAVLLLVAFAILFLVFKAVIGVWNRVHDNNRQQTSASDARRKKDLELVGNKLAAYYTKHSTYPTLTELNSPDFSKRERGFAVAAYHDPNWEENNTACTDAANKSIFASSRADGCYAYRTTAVNGADCNAKDIPCTRIVLTTNLGSGGPHIIVLNNNARETAL